MHDYDIFDNYYDRLRLSNHVKHNLLNDINYKKAPQNVKNALYDFSNGLSTYINKRYDLPIYIENSFFKLWEILSTFNLIPSNITSFRILNLFEKQSQMIMCFKYWAEKKCKNIDMKNFEWVSSLNPYNTNELQKENYNKFSSGNDIKNSKDSDDSDDNDYNDYNDDDDDDDDDDDSKNIKYYNNKWLINKYKINLYNIKQNNINLIIADGSILYNYYVNSEQDKKEKLFGQKLDLSQVLSVLICSNFKSSCCIKHYIPYKSIDNTTYQNKLDSDDDTEFFLLSYLYMYYVAFDSITFFKPNSSNSDSSEFYVIGKGFKGISKEHLENLFSILENFKLNQILIDKDKIPNTFLTQIRNFMEQLGNTNVLSLEKQNLLLTCYKSYDENDYSKTKNINKILKCDNFLNDKQISTILIPKYKEWIKTFNFE